jgi:lipoprotein-anchoring transpeptidase ErfK/SrfK
MISRRLILSAAAAACAMPALPALAQQSPRWSVPEDWMPVVVRIRSNFAPGEIHVDPSTFNLYLTMSDGRAIRYKVGIGRGNLYEPGSFYLGAKKEWPGWRPTDEMIARDPDSYAQWADGMPGGPGNPLGSRALYLFTPGRGDTFLRIHGTPEPWTIGSAVSNGCVRLVNSHVEDLYARTPLGAPIVLHPKLGTA